MSENDQIPTGSDLPDAGSQPDGGGFTDAMGEPDLDAREADEVIDQDVMFGTDQDQELNRSWSPPERPLALDRYGNTLAEERAGETLDQRLAQEEPDPALAVDPFDPRDPESGPGEESGPDDPQELADELAEEPLDRRAGEEVQERSGRLMAPDQGLAGDTEQDLVAQDVGIDGGAASAEEAAVHVVDADHLPGAVDDPSGDGYLDPPVGGDVAVDEGSTPDRPPGPLPRV